MTSMGHPGDLYEVLYDFRPEQQGDLALRQGDIVTVTHKAGSWWNGSLRGGGPPGLFPSQVVRPVVRDLSDRMESMHLGSPPPQQFDPNSPHQPPSSQGSFHPPPSSPELYDPSRPIGPNPHAHNSPMRQGGYPPNGPHSYSGPPPQQWGYPPNNSPYSHSYSGPSPQGYPPPNDHQPRDQSNYQSDHSRHPENSYSRPPQEYPPSHGSPHSSEPQGYPPPNKPQSRDQYDYQSDRPLHTDNSYARPHSQQGYPPNSSSRELPSQQGYPPNSSQREPPSQQGYPPPRGSPHSYAEPPPQQWYSPHHSSNDHQSRAQYDYRPDHSRQQGPPPSNQSYRPENSYDERPHPGYPPPHNSSRSYPPNDRQQSYSPNHPPNDYQPRDQHDHRPDHSRQQGSPPSNQSSRPDNSSVRPPHQQGPPSNGPPRDYQSQDQHDFLSNDSRYLDNSSVRPPHQQGPPLNDPPHDYHPQNQRDFQSNDSRYLDNSSESSQKELRPTDPEPCHGFPPRQASFETGPPRPTQGLQPNYPSANLGEALGRIIRENSAASRGWDQKIRVFVELLGELQTFRLSKEVEFKLRDFEDTAIRDLVERGGRLCYRSQENFKKAVEFYNSKNEGVLFENQPQLLQSIPNDRYYEPKFNGLTFDFIKFQKHPTDGNIAVLTDEAREFLESIKMPVALITVVGRFRSGKSYLLNNLAGLECRAKQVMEQPVNSNFSVSKVDRGETTGMRAYPLFIPPGQRLPDQWPASHTRNGACLLLVDSQGFQDPKAEDGDNLDAKILSLALLLSSLLVVNVMTAGGAIMRDDLNHLGMVTEVTNSMKMGGIPKDSTLNPKDYLHNVFPDLLWVARNSNVQYKKEPTAVLEDLLTQTEGGPKVNAQRRAIRESFNNIKMFPLSDPEKNALPGDELAPETWSDTFRNEFNDLIELILSMVKLKRGYSHEVGPTDPISSGEDFLSLVEGIIQTSNAHGMPDFTVSLEKIHDAHRAKLATRAERIFNEEMEKDKEPLNSQDFQEKYNQAITKALSIYGKFKENYKPAGEARIGVVVDGQLPASDTRLAYYIELNDKRARNHNRELIRDLFVPMENKIREGKYTSEEFINDCRAAQTKYQGEAKGSEDLLQECFEERKERVKQNRQMMEMLRVGGGQAFEREMAGLSMMYREGRELKAKAKIQKLRTNEGQKKNIRLQVQAQQMAFEKRNQKRAAFTGHSRRDVEFEEREQRAKREQQLTKQMIQESKARESELEAQNQTLQSTLHRMQNAEASQRDAYLREFEAECERKGKSRERVLREARVDFRYHHQPVAPSSRRQQRREDACSIL